MENEDESVKTENMGAEGSIQGKKHGFSSHSSGHWNQDEMISSAEKDSKVHNYHRNRLLLRKRPDRAMTLTICNEYSSPISVAIAYYNPNECANAGKWRKVGWYNIAPGVCRVVYNSNLTDVNSHWLYYARYL